MEQMEQHPVEIWTVLEIQGLGGDSKASNSVCYDNEAEALAGYFTVCAAAARSELPYHAAVLIPPVQPYNKQITYWQIFNRPEVY